jgi:hypothetical protein
LGVVEANCEANLEASTRVEAIMTDGGGGRLMERGKVGKDFVTGRWLLGRKDNGREKRERGKVREEKISGRSRPGMETGDGQRLISLADGSRGKRIFKSTHLKDVGPGSELYRGKGMVSDRIGRYEQPLGILSSPTHAIVSGDVGISKLYPSKRAHPAAWLRPEWTLGKHQPTDTFPAADPTNQP